MNRTRSAGLMVVVSILLGLLFLPELSLATDLDEKDVLTVDELIDGSKKEGKIVLYTTHPEIIIRALLEGFKKSYPWVETDPVTGGGPQIAQRFYSDKAVGVEKCDYVCTGMAEVFPDWKRKGYLGRVDNLPNWNAAIELAQGKGGRYISFDFVPHIMAWDRNVYKDEEVPSDLWEFTKPKWKDKTASGDPATAGFAAMWYSFACDCRLKDPRSPAAPSGLGFEWMRAMSKNGLLLAGQIGNTTDTIVSGRRPILVHHWVQEIWMANKQGANLGWRYPDQGTIAQHTLAGVNSKAPHPYTAKLFVNWLLSKEAQTLLVKDMGFDIVRKDMRTSDFIKGRKPVEECWVLDVEQITPEKTREFLSKVNEALRGRR